MNRIVSVEPRVLPTQYPSEIAMKNNRHNKHSYDPEVWDFEYSTRRYLEYSTDQELKERYFGILKALRSFEGTARYDCPINVVFGPWYWLRLEHHCRVEFKIRGVEPYEVYLPSPAKTPTVFAESKIPQGEKFLFRYTKRKWARDLRDNGGLFFQKAEAYANQELRQAQQDDERTKVARIPGGSARIVLPDGTESRPIGDIKRSVGGPSYIQVSLGVVWDPYMFEAFSADTCVVVRDPEAFLKRIEIAGREVFPAWYYMHAPIQYFDPYNMRPNEFFDAAMSKDLKYAYQREYRVLFANMNDGVEAESRKLQIGECGELVELYDVDGNIIL